MKRMSSSSLPPPPHQRRLPARQRGAALLTAMIIVTVVVTLAAAMVWQQWRAVQVESAERARVQSSWILSGALDWARLILREDQNSGKPTALGNPWSTKLEEARISTFLAIDKSNTNDGPEAFLSGNITDAQSRYNLSNLLITTAAPIKGRAAPETEDESKVLERLCSTLSLDSSVSQRIVKGLREANATQPNSDTASAATPLVPRTVAQLSWLGIDKAAIEALKPYVVILPVVTQINVNTASREVLTAAIKELDMATAERLVQFRQRNAFNSVEAFKTQLPGLKIAEDKLTVRSSFFEVRSRLRLDDRVLTELSLVERQPSRQIKVLQRERVTGLDHDGK
jgi:general secretion pathway protein K